MNELAFGIFDPTPVIDAEDPHQFAEMPRELSLKSLRLFGERVIPAFGKQLTVSGGRPS